MSSQLNWFQLFLDYAGIFAIVINFFLATVVWLWKKRIEQNFMKELEDYRNKSTKELEGIRSQLSVIRDMKNALNPKEIEVIMNLWEKIQIARGKLMDLTKPLKTYPDFRYKNKEEIEEILNKVGFSENHKEELRGSSDMNKYYQEKLFEYDYRQAQNLYNDFHNYFILYKVLFHKELQKKIAEFDQLLSSALLDIETAFLMAGDLRPQNDLLKNELIYKAYSKASEECEPIMKDIEDIIQKKLHIS